MIKNNKCKAKILIVDDEPDVLASYQEFFSSRGYLVKTTASGKDALVLINTLKPDLVFLDLTLMEMDGKEVLKELRKRDKELKVVIITGDILDSGKEMKEFYSLGISTYINKPVVLADLEQAIKSVPGRELSLESVNSKSFVKRSERPISSIIHKLINLLGNMRNECEVFT